MNPLELWPVWLVLSVWLCWLLRHENKKAAVTNDPAKEISDTFHRSEALLKKEYRILPSSLFSRDLNLAVPLWAGRLPLFVARAIVFIAL
jgi:hypothetical protein